jgi:outer membrane murein-binding lipoprotein Lpp
LQAQQNQINSDRARLDGLRSSGQIAKYNSGVDNFNSQVFTFNATVRKLRADIASFNQLVEARNAIASELASLNQAIDTRQAPQTIE